MPPRYCKTLYRDLASCQASKVASETTAATRVAVLAWLRTRFWPNEGSGKILPSREARSGQRCRPLTARASSAWSLVRAAFGPCHHCFFFGEKFGPRTPRQELPRPFIFPGCGQDQTIIRCYGWITPLILIQSIHDLQCTFNVTFAQERKCVSGGVGWIRWVSVRQFRRRFPRVISIHAKQE